MSGDTRSGGAGGSMRLETIDVPKPNTPPSPNTTRARSGGQPNESVQKANADGKAVIGASAKKAQLQEMIDAFDQSIAEKDKQIADEKAFEKNVSDTLGADQQGTSRIPGLERERAGMVAQRDILVDARDNIGPAAEEAQKGNYWPMLGLFAEREPLVQVAGEGVAGKVASVAGKLAGKAGSALGRLGETIGLRKPRPASRPSPGAEGESIQGGKGRRNGTGTRCTWPCTKKPVALADGAKVTFDVEFTLPGVLPLELARSYASDLGHDGPLGRNRIGSLDEVLVREPDGSLLYRMGSGLTAGFDRPTGNIGEVSRNARHPHLALSAAGNRAYAVRDHGLTKRFDKGKDGIWRLAEIRDPNGHRATFRRDAAGLLQRLDRSDGFTLLFENDARGLREAVTLQAPGGETRPLLRYAYDAQGNLTEARNAYGPSLRYEYDAAGRFCAYDDGVETRNTYAYDEAGRVVAVTTPGGRFDYRLAYGPDGHTTTLVHADRPDGGRRYTFDANGRALTETDALGRVRRFERDALGTLLAETDAEGHRTTYAYDAFGTLSAVTDPEGRRTAYHHDEDGRLERRIDPAGHTWTWTYDGRGNLVSAIDPLGHRTDYATNEAGLPVAIMRHDGLIERRDYDASHNLVRLVDYRGGTTLFERDAFGRLTARTDPLGHVTRFSYDERPGADFWAPTALTRPDGVTVRRDPEPRQATLTLTDGEGRRTLYRYGPFDLLEAIEDPKGGSLRFSYDAEERLVRVENQLGRHWTFTRDAAGRVVEETNFDGMTLAYAYDGADRVSETRHPDAGRIAYAYDRAGLLLRQEAFAPGATPPEVTRFAYDRAGRVVEAETPAALVRLERNALGQVTAEEQNGQRIESAYDCCGNRTGRRIGDRLAAATYDPLGALSGLAIGEHAPLRFTRDAAGREVLRESAAGFRLEQAWDAVGQLARQRGGRELGPAGMPPGPGVERAYAWSRDFAPRVIADARWGETAYETDAAGQIVETRFGDGEAERFAYDPALNLCGLGDATSRLQAWQLAAGGRAERARGPHGETIHLAYDARRRVVERRVERDGFRPKTWRYGWDAQDRLVGCETPSGERWAYGYDAFGRRVWKRRLLDEGEEAWVRGKFPHLVRSLAAGGRSALDVWPRRPAGARDVDVDPPVVGRAYLWDGDVVAQEAALRLDGSAEWERATSWHFEPGTFVPVVKEEADGRLRYVVTDQLGTPREMFEESGALVWAAAYRTWGAVRRLWLAEADNDNRGGGGWGLGGPSGRVWGGLALEDVPAAAEAVLLCPIRFQGQWQDAETGLVYNRFRYYDPLIGQYASPDPIGILGGYRISSYVYSPSLLIDPLGLICCPALKDDSYHPDNVKNRIKPPYEANPAHDPSSPLFNPKKGIEPPDASEVYQNAIRGQQNLTSAPTWYGIGRDGQIYRFFGDGAGSAHFSGYVPPTSVPNDVLKSLGINR